MPTNECIPYFEPGVNPTGKCASTVRGCRIVSLASQPSGGFVGTENPNIQECAGATQVPIAVAKYDGATGDQIPIMALRSGAIVPLTVGASVTAGELVMSDSQGRITPFVGPVATNAAALPDLPVHVGVVLETNAVVDTQAAVWLI